MKRIMLPLLGAAALLLLAACQPALLNPPRVATQAAQSPNQTPTPDPLRLPAPTPTGESSISAPPTVTAVDPNPTITLWVNETSAAHRAVLEEMAVDLNERFSLHLEYVLVNPERMPELVASAQISNALPLPDLIVHPLEFTLGWAAQGVLDPEAATAVVAQLDPATFDQQALDLARLEDGNLAAVPSDGWQQLLVYRQDWFESLNRPAPLRFTDIISGAQAIYRSPELAAQTGISQTLISGLVVPTEADLRSTQYVFEHLAVANGCDLVDSKGEVMFIHPACLDTLDFYRDLVNSYSPSDVQTDISALNAYRAGRTGMIIVPPSALPVLAGLEEDFPPTCGQCVENPQYLAQNSGIVTTFEGRSEFSQAANFGHVTFLGITRSADAALAQRFAEYWFTEGYLKWLAVEPERKAPMRRSMSGSDEAFVDAWATLPLRGPDSLSLADTFGVETARSLSENIAASSRWGFAQGQGELISLIAEDATFPIVLQEMLSGYFTTSQAVIEAYERVVDLIPNYAYTIEPTPTPEVESTDDG